MYVHRCIRRLHFLHSGRHEVCSPHLQSRVFQEWRTALWPFDPARSPLHGHNGRSQWWGNYTHIRVCNNWQTIECGDLYLMGTAHTVMFYVILEMIECHSKNTRKIELLALACQKTSSIHSSKYLLGQCRLFPKWMHTYKKLFCLQYLVLMQRLEISRWVNSSRHVVAIYPLTPYFLTV